MVFLVGVAFAMLASSLWMAIGPQLPAFRTRRRALARLTWLVTRGPFAVIALRIAAHLPVPPWSGYMAAEGLGLLRTGAAAGPAAAAFDSPLGAGGLAPLVLAADFAIWRALAAAEGGDSEAVWNWVASPFALWIGVAFGTPRLVAVALVALAHLLQRRGFGAASGIALGAAAAWGGPAALVVAIALALAPGRALGRVLAAVAAGAVVLAVLRVAAPAPWGWAWLPPAEPGGGLSLWRWVHASTGFVPGAWAWLPALALLLAGFARLVPRGVGAPALAAWAFGACAMFAPSFTVRAALPFAPLLVVWAGDDPDRRGWWFIENLALALSAVLELVAFRGESRVTGWLAGVAVIGGAAFLALWPLRVLLRAPADPGAARPA